MHRGVFGRTLYIVQTAAGHSNNMHTFHSYQDILAYIDTFDVTAYAKTRNHLTGTVSKLSPYITRGVINLPTIRNRILERYSYEQAEKFIQELAWREYFQKIWFAKGDAIFSDLRFTRHDWVTKDVLTACVDAYTGISVIDTQLRELFETGYMHNHARMWTAMLACNVGKAHWYNMGRFMYYHLLDGDLASNFLSWQWVAGTSASKQYTANQELIDACSGTREPQSYLDIPREHIGTTNIPPPLLDYTPFTYTTLYPQTNLTESLQGRSVFLYHPWTLDPLWRSHQEGIRILVIEPRIFERFPVSSRVMDFIVQVATTYIPQIKIYVGNVETLPGIEHAVAVYSKSYPATKHWPGTIDAHSELFPSVTGYFPSFFKFWEACGKTAV